MPYKGVGYVQGNENIGKKKQSNKPKVNTDKMAPGMAGNSGIRKPNPGRLKAKAMRAASALR